MLENRRHLRIRQFMDATWSMPGEDMAGQAQILNVSSSGLLIQIDDSFKPLEHSVLSIDPELNEEEPPFLNRRAKVMWFRRIKTARYSYQCGVEFLKGNSPDDGLVNWIENKTTQIAQITDPRILNNYAF